MFTKIVYRAVFFGFAGIPLGMTAQNVRVTEAEIQLQDKFIEALTKQQVGKPEIAYKLFGDILAKNPSCDACYFQMARISETQNQFPKAMESAKKAVAIDPENRWYRLMVIGLLERAGKEKEATEMLAQLVEKIDFQEDLHNRLAYLWVRISEPDKALKVYDKMEKYLGVQEELARKKYMIYTAKGDSKKALAELKKMSEYNPQNVEYLHELAAFYENIGDKAAAKAVYQHILTFDKNNTQAALALATKTTAPTAGMPASASTDIARLNDLKDLFSKKELNIDLKVKELIPFVNKVADKHEPQLTATCLELARIIEKTHPNEAKSYALMGDLLQHNGQFTEALEKYEKCISLNANVFSVWEQMMYLYDQTEQYDKLSKVSEKVTDLFPNQATGFYFQGVSNVRLGKLNDAFTPLEQALMMSSKKPPLKHDILLELGTAHNKAGRTEKSDKMFEDALKMNPKSPFAMVKYSIALASRSGSTEKTRLMTAEALKITQNSDPIILELYGDYLFKTGAKEEALKYWLLAKEKGNKAPSLEKKIKDKTFE
jgi:tetratricopeptide (TPR) repeat protein